MRVFLLILLALAPFRALSMGPFTPLSGMEEGSPETLLFLSDGRVGRIDFQSPILSRIRTLHQKRTPLGVQLDKSGWVLAIQKLSTPVKSLPGVGGTGPDLLLPSVLSPEEAKEVFLSMNPNFRRRSQCFNRAHVWTYETLNIKKIQLMKVFMFFTAKYIRDYHYRWWFHVSPFAYVEENGSVRESILDFTFMNEPVSPKEWSDHFIKPKTSCPTVTKYSDYSTRQYDHYCYFMKVPIFFWQPRHLEAHELGSAAPTGFIHDEVLAAYHQAFYGVPVP